MNINWINIIFGIGAVVLISLVIFYPMEIETIIETECECESNGVNGVYFSNANKGVITKTMTNEYKTGEWVCIDIEHRNYLEAVQTCNHEVGHRIVQDSESFSEFMESGEQDYYYDENYVIYTKFNGNYVELN